MSRKRAVKSRDFRRGFSLLEILLVVVIIGVLVAVVVPRAQRANTAAKYNIVRQSAQEIGNWGMEWAKRNLESQAESIDCIMYHYVDTLLGYTGDTSTNWVDDSAYANATCPNGIADINFGVEDIMPKDKQPRNPFNGTSYFVLQNAGGTSWAPGDLNLARFIDADQYRHYYFIYHGMDSTGPGVWHAGMGTADLAGLRNGVFMARLK